MDPEGRPKGRDRSSGPKGSGEERGGEVAPRPFSAAPGCDDGESAPKQSAHEETAAMHVMNELKPMPNLPQKEERLASLKRKLESLKEKNSASCTALASGARQNNSRRAAMAQGPWPDS